MPRHEQHGEAAAGAPGDLLAVVAEPLRMHAPIGDRWLTGGYGNDSAMPPIGGAGLRTLSPTDGGCGRVPPDDDDLSLPLVRAKRILEVLRAPTDRRRVGTCNWPIWRLTRRLGDQDSDGIPPRHSATRRYFKSGGLQLGASIRGSTSRSTVMPRPAAVARAQLARTESGSRRRRRAP